MNEEKTYHIDVTPEEDALFNPEAVFKLKEKNKKNTPISFGKVFCVVVGVHAVIGVGIIATTSSAEAKPKEQVDLAQPVDEIPKQYQEETTKATPTPTPLPVATVEPMKQSTSDSNKPLNGKYTKEYTVKQGDTLYSIAKKYKLNTERLIKINNIKDVNKLTVGQKLKFM